MPTAPASRRWTRDEDAKLRELFFADVLFTLIADHLDRTPREVLRRIEYKRLRIARDGYATTKCDPPQPRLAPPVVPLGEGLWGCDDDGVTYFQLAPVGRWCGSWVEKTGSLWLDGEGLRKVATRETAVKIAAKYAKTGRKA